MRAVFAAATLVTAAVSFGVGTVTGTPRSERPAPGRARIEALNGVIDHYCTECHNEQLLVGNLSLEGYDIASATKERAKSEKMIRKLRAEMMPLPGSPRPTGDSLRLVAETIEDVIDRNTPANPGSRTFQRLNRAEYANAIRDLLGLEIDAGNWLPLDTKSANFDNIADVQMLSPTLLESYLNAAASVSKLAVGDKNATLALTTYPVSLYVSQHPWDHADGAPYGTRGGVVADHTFPADGLYEFRMNVEGGVGMDLEDLDISIDGARVALVHYERGVDKSIQSADLPLGVDLFRTEPIRVKAGTHRVSAAFVRRTDGPYEDLIKPHDWSMASNGTASAGTTAPPAMLDMSVLGPQKTFGVSETPSRRMIFSCRPSAALGEKACAQQIITRLGTRAYRRPLTQHDRDGLMSFYTKGAADGGGFEGGVRSALQAMLSSPYFVFRFEAVPSSVAPGQDYQISDLELASRLSFFLWASIPDDELLTLAQQKKLSQPATLSREVKRMLADPRSDALATRFAGQWLRLSDIEKVRPDVFWFPDFDQQLADDMRHETELFFANLVKQDRSVLELFTANYTFLNERLARHYGIPNVSGDQFRMVAYPDSTRRGVLGQGSMLVQTSVANRTSPVLRGKWVMQVLLGVSPPPPPPNVPTLDETQDSKDGKPLTTRERMELHRSNPTCKTCHQYMDPIGLALDNFDVTGRWRYRENTVPLDTRGNMYDGTPVSSPSELVNALLKRPIPLVRTFTENLMAYGLGRRVEDFDQPTVRVIARDAADHGYKFSSFVNGVVNSAAFRMRRVEPVAADAERQQR